jgi:predicted SnoaL-like aldol condensation-catalyzing enzyme
MKLKKNILVVITTGFLFFSAFSQGNKEDQNKAVAKKMYKAFETGDANVLSQYVASDYVERSPDPKIKAKGLEGLKEAVLFHYKTATSMKMTILHMAADGDIVMVHANIKDHDSTPEKDPKDAPAGVNGVDVFRFENGKAVEHWGYFK